MQRLLRVSRDSELFFFFQYFELIIYSVYCISPNVMLNIPRCNVSSMDCERGVWEARA